ncbi:MAG TPA: hypothetical protein VM282_00805 [Acidimicrobiales bacterium]|nr:hypothetical protein [Acidimicrobiales bacterium]
MVSHADIAHFTRFGYVVLRRAIDPQPLCDEVDRAFREGSRAPFEVTVAGGRNRRQWRVDFVADPTDTEQEAAVRDYFTRLYVPGWDGGYDADLYPTYGEDWRASGRAWLDRLDQLGAHDAAAAEEAALKS